MKSENRTKREKIILFFCMSVMFLFAFSISMIGLLLPAIINEFDVSLSQAGIISVAQNAGGIVALAFCGYLSDRFGKQKVILTLFAAMTAALLACCFTKTFVGFVVIAMVLGLTASTLNMCVSAYLSECFPGRENFYVNLGGVLFGLGSVLGPVYVTFFSTRVRNWRVLFTSTGMLCTFIFVVGLLQFYGKKKNQKAAKTENDGGLGRTEFIRLLKNPQLWFFALTGFFYMSHSSAFMAWIPTYLTTQYQEGSFPGNYLMTTYWISILAGRLFCTWRANQLNYKNYMVAANLVGGLAMLGCLRAHGPYLMVLFLIIGISTGAVFQVCLAETCRRFASISGTASSIVAFSASVGGTLACYITGVFADNFGFQASLGYLGIVLLLIPVIMLLQERRRI